MRFIAEEPGPRPAVDGTALADAISVLKRPCGVDTLVRRAAGARGRCAQESRAGRAAGLVSAPAD